jgi:hypothetical protein
VPQELGGKGIGCSRGSGKGVYRKARLVQKKRTKIKVK